MLRIIFIFEFVFIFGIILIFEFAIRNCQYHKLDYIAAPLQTIPAYLCFYLGMLDKRKENVMIHSEKLEWWIILMVNCVTTLIIFQNKRDTLRQ